MSGSATGVIAMLLLVSGSGRGTGERLAVWVDTKDQPAGCTAVRMQEQLDHLPDVRGAASANIAVVRVNLTSCREHFAAAVPPPGLTRCASETRRNR